MNEENMQVTERLALNKVYAEEIQKWYDTTTAEERAKSGQRFLLGQTTDVLKSIGVKDYNIYIGASKINKILKDNSSMTLDIIKSAINLLEDPILIMQSKTIEGSIVVFGGVYTEGHKPVMLSVLLNPENKDGEVMDFAVVTSVYGRRTQNLQNLIDKSKIYYVNEQKNRTDTWLKALGLQLPSALTTYGSINIIPQNQKKSTLSREKISNERRD